MEIELSRIYNHKGLTDEAKRHFSERIPKLRYIDVGRYRWPFCLALIKESYDEGYCLTAQFLENITLMNDHFMKSSKAANVCNDKEFLVSLMEHLKSAESCALLLQQEEKSLKILLNTAVYIENTKPQFLWLSEQFYVLLVHLADKFQNKFEETLARALYYYAHLLNRKLNNYEDAVSNLYKCLQLCQGRQWTILPGVDTCLSKYVCEELCDSLLNVARKIEKASLADAEIVAKEAICVLIQGSKDKRLYSKAGLQRVEYLVKLERYECALKVLHKIFPHVYSFGKSEYKIQLLLYQGICLFHLSKYVDSAKKLRKALRMEGLIHLKHLRARILYYLGRIYARKKSTFIESQNYLREAKDIFERVGDFKNVQKLKFLSGMLKANEVLPHLINMIKERNPENNKKIWEWMDSTKPFWTDRTINDVQHPDELFVEPSFLHICECSDEVSSFEDYDCVKEDGNDDAIKKDNSK